MNVVSRPDLSQPLGAGPQTFVLTPAHLDLVRDLNRGLSRREFDHFIETSRFMGLNPLRRQICAIILNESDARKRHVAIVTTISGLRAIADRSGTYRPDDKPARLNIDKDAIHPQANPHGIIDCTVTPCRFAHGRWHRIVGQVWWDEIAPIRTDSEGGRYLDSRTPWPIRPRGQIIKCAEAAALRAGWPESLANVYAEDELDRSRMAPSDLADTGKLQRQQEDGQPFGTILIDMLDGNGLSNVPVSQFHSRVNDLIRSSASRLELLEWREQSRAAFRQFFTYDKHASVDLKKKFEVIEAELASAEEPGSMEVTPIG